MVEKLKELSLKAGSHVLVLGTGNFGKNVARNLKIYLPNLHVTVSNRTDAKAVAFAQAEGFDTLPYSNFIAALPQFDAVITCAGAEDSYLINSFETTKNIVFLDTAIPSAVNPEIAHLPNVQLFDIDALSQIMDKTLAKRKAEVPKAMEIIRKVLLDFVEWHKIYLQRWFVLQVKDTLYQISDKHKLHLDAVERKQKVQKSVNHLVVRLKKDNKKGCHFIEAINQHLN